MNTNFELPMILSAKELQAMGFSRSMAYQLLQGDIIPVITVGKHRFIRHTALLAWLTEQEKTSSPTTANTAGEELSSVTVLDDEEGDTA